MGLGVHGLGVSRGPKDHTNTRISLSGSKVQDRGDTRNPYVYVDCWGLSTAFLGFVDFSRLDEGLLPLTQLRRSLMVVQLRVPLQAEVTSIVSKEDPIPQTGSFQESGGPV